MRDALVTTINNELYNFSIVTDSDFGLVDDLDRLCFDHNDLEKFYHANGRKGYIYVLKHEHNKNVIGYILVYEQTRVNPYFAYIFRIGVDPKFRRQGFASEMIDLTVDRLLEKGRIKILECDVRHSNNASRLMFERNGFWNIALLDGLYHPCEIGIRMRRIL